MRIAGRPRRDSRPVAVLVPPRSRGRAPDTPTGRRVDWPIGLDSVAKLSTALGAAIYTGLFIAYDSYYSVLGIRPEDIGLTYGFVLTRSLALLTTVVSVAVILLVLGAYLSGVVALGRRPGGRAGSRAWQIPTFALVALTILEVREWPGILAALRHGFYGSVATPRQLFLSWLYAGATLGLTLLIVGAFIAVVFDRRLRLRVLSAVLAPLVAAAFAGTVAVARHAAEVALHGAAVCPLNLFGLPWLDVEATPVTVQWVGPVAQRPAWLDDTGEVHRSFVGQNASTVFLLNVTDVSGPALTRVPVASVSVSTRSFTLADPPESYC